MAAGSFRIFAVRHVDEALALLTGEAPGEPDESGRFPEQSVNGRVQARLAAFAEAIKAARGADEKDQAKVDENAGDHEGEGSGDHKKGGGGNE